MSLLIKIIASFFYIGYSPYASGTVASLVGMLLYYVVKDNPLTYSLTAFILFLLGFLTAGRAEEIFNERDSYRIVIDEVASLFLVFIGIPYRFLWIVIGFLVYRLFDVFKPFPIRQSQNLIGSLGIMIDDIIAAVYTNIILQILVRIT